ncbi:MAG: PKD domain-containing protein [Thermoplasmata archaeon]|nr:MAG: PKD domain-containing protein [Thermoplasmata archaeon]
MPNYGSGWKIAVAIGLKPFPGEVRPVANAGGPYVGNEGSSITFNAGGSSDGDGDALKYRWDFDGDGDWDTSWSSSTTASHTWYDDYTGDVYLEVFDGRLRDMDITTVTVNNVAPTATAVGDVIYENGIATVSGTISDPGTLDTFTVHIKWSDGPNEEFDYPAGSTTFSETHQYLDDNPTGTPSDVYDITIWVEDDDSGDANAFTSVTVNNVAPSITAVGDTIDENDFATVSGTITDPGTQDTFTIIIDWGEGAPEVFYYPAGSTTYSETHQYLDDNPTGTLSDVYPISVSITDDDTLGDADTTSVTVNNVDPVTSIDAMAQPNPQFILPIIHTLDFTGSFTDVGTLDTHSAVWDWGDSTSDVGTLTQASGSGTVTGSHVYMVPGFYTVTLTVTDDDGGVHSDTFLVEVVDAHGALSIMNDYIQGLDDSAFAKNPANTKKTYSNMIDALHHKVDAENYKGAISDMQNNMRGKSDGTMGGKANNDWIVDGSVQYEMTMKLDDISAYLATFL